jgi:hypothetical protein
MLRRIRKAATKARKTMVLDMRRRKSANSADRRETPGGPAKLSWSSQPESNG